MLGKRKGQGTLEYAIIIAAVVAALLAINMYMKKAVQGKLRDTSDEIGRQFEPDKFSSTVTTQSSGQTTTTEFRDTENGTTVSTIEQAETITTGENTSWGSGS